MARRTERLTALQIGRLKASGNHPDGNGLYLQIAGNARSWVFRYSINGRERYLGLGSLAAVGLAAARQKAADARKLIADGIDPISAKHAARGAAAAEAGNAMTFAACAAAYIKSHGAGWRSEKHAAQWTATLSTYAYPVFGKLAVGDIAVGHVMKVLEPIWTARPATASRVRGRIEAVLGWATARGFRRGDNPALWRGHLQNLLPSPRKVHKVEHYAALAYEDIGEFMNLLRGLGYTASRALQFVILTAARTSEATGARWSEIDLRAATWTIPANRMKAGREHRVPLSSAAIAVLPARPPFPNAPDDFVFPGGRKGRPLSNGAMLALLRRMGRDDVTPHGFRSTFRDWAAERTNYPREVAEMALAHAVSDKVEAAYRRGDLFEKRRRLMNEWAAFCGKRRPQSGAKVVTIHRAG
jgi:integrase